MGFGQIAKVYDRFNDLDSYEIWLDFTLNMHQGQPRNLLDLACGTGWFTQLIEPFIAEEVMGIDIDPAMLAIAQAELQPDSQLHFLQGDMTQLPEGLGQFDIITCYADSLCFLADIRQVAATFHQAALHLNSDGVFLFDVWTPYQVQEGFANFSYFDSDEDYALMWDSEVEIENLKVYHYLTVFQPAKQEKGLFERIEAELEERTYPLAAYYSALEAAGFKQVEVWVDQGRKPYDPVSDSACDRWFFACRK